MYITTLAYILVGVKIRSVAYFYRKAQSIFQFSLSVSYRTFET